LPASTLKSIGSLAKLLNTEQVRNESDRKESATDKKRTAQLKTDIREGLMLVTENIFNALLDEKHKEEVDTTRSLTKKTLLDGASITQKGAIQSLPESVLLTILQAANEEAERFSDFEETIPDIEEKARGEFPSKKVRGRVRELFESLQELMEDARVNYQKALAMGSTPESKLKQLRQRVAKEEKRVELMFLEASTKEVDMRINAEDERRHRRWEELLFATEDRDNLEKFRADEFKTINSLVRYSQAEREARLQEIGIGDNDEFDDNRLYKHYEETVGANNPDLTDKQIKENVNRIMAIRRRVNPSDEQIREAELLIYGPKKTTKKQEAAASFSAKLSEDDSDIESEEDEDYNPEEDEYEEDSDNSAVNTDEQNEASPQLMGGHGDSFRPTRRFKPRFNSAKMQHR
jgi:hypothetical protein